MLNIGDVVYRKYYSNAYGVVVEVQQPSIFSFFDKQKVKILYFAGGVSSHFVPHDEFEKVKSHENNF